MAAIWLVTSAACWPATTRADDNSKAATSGSTWQQAPWALEAHLGVGMPVGLAGISLDWSPIERVSLQAGMGVGTGRDGGSLRLAFGSRARVIRLGPSWLTFGVDYSTGGWEATSLDVLGGLMPSHGSDDKASEPVLFADRLHWLQASLGIEQRLESGVLVRLYGGIGTPLNPADIRCRRADRQPCQVTAEEHASHQVFLCAGGALGIAF